MRKFKCVEQIPPFPRSKTPEEHLKHCKEFIEAGAIPKSELIEGAIYLGRCRNAKEALWNGSEFVYIRHKWASIFRERIKHFEDDDGCDVFIPIKKLIGGNNLETIQLI